MLCLFAYIEYNYGNTLSTSLTEDEILEGLSDFRDCGCVKCIVLTVELGFTLQASKLDMCYLFTHQLYFSTCTDSGRIIETFRSLDHCAIQVLRAQGTLASYQPTTQALAHRMRFQFCTDELNSSTCQTHVDWLEEG
jgi:hypothetical protein